MKKIKYVVAAVLVSVAIFQTSAQIVRVPADYKTIADAVKSSSAGDTIIISPGEYHENNIIITKPLTISSEWILTGNKNTVEQTVIYPDDSKLFSLNTNGIEISGLKIINGNHPLDINARAKISHNHFIHNLDAVSMESKGGGYVGYNKFENDRDDGIDLDIKTGSDIIIEYNTIINSNDDGIEIRLFKNPEQNIHYEISHNIFIGSKRTGLQLISYDVYTGKVFNVHHNIFRNCKTGLGCMEGAKSTENLRGASKMDEFVYLYNNTMIDNEMGATGGNSVIAINNIIVGNKLGGFKRFGKNSVVTNNLFYNNNNNNFIEFDNSAKKYDNIIEKDPLLDKVTLYPDSKSPCINTGLNIFVLDNSPVIKISSEEYAGSAPDIGALEKNGKHNSVQIKGELFVDAGSDLVIKAPASHINLKGFVRSNSSGNIRTEWKLAEGPAKADIKSPEKLSTEINLYNEGIYKFSIICTGKDKSSTDQVTIRYIKSGEGKSLFIKNNVYEFEAEDFAYAYGETSVISGQSFSNGSCVLLKAKEGVTTMLEYSIGTAHDADFSVWLRVRTPKSKHNTLLLVFNNRELENINLSKKKQWEWIKVPEKITATPGQWQFLISGAQGSVYIDKMIFSQDSGYVPEN